MSTLVHDIAETDFTQVVVEGSRTRPVVVDFWAEWCGPCHQLSPALEQAAERFAGEVDVVKVDVDANQRLAQQFGVQGIPAVKAFADGQVVAEFTGLQPPAVIEQFFAALTPSPADRLVAQAAADPPQAEALLRQALTDEVDHPDASLALAHLLVDADDIDGARAVLATARPTPEVQQLQAALSLAGEGGDIGDLDVLQAAVDRGDDGAQVVLGKALAARGRHEEAIAVLLEAVRMPGTRDEAREALVAVFTALGGEHPLVRASRPKLAAAVF